MHQKHIDALMSKIAGEHGTFREQTAGVSQP
jgi:hypothetical protein